MLRITVIKNAQGAMKYFESALVQQDYYSQDDKITGRWEGLVSEKLGIRGEVTKEQYQAIVSNRSPLTGEKLTPRDKAERRVGYDFTFNASKSVSLLYSITRDEDILKSHQEAVCHAMASIEANMQTQNGQGKKKEYIQTGNILYAAFDHFTTRPVKQNGQIISDPHLHTHAMIKNVTWYEAKNRFQAIEIFNIKKEAPYYEAIYHAKLAQLLQQKGYEIERKGHGFEIKGIERSTIEKFSLRTKQIQNAIEENGITDERVKAKIGAWTRLKKVELPETELYQNWVSRLTPDELDRILNAKKVSKGEAVKGGESRVKEVVFKTQEPKIAAGKVIDLALSHFLERKSTVNEKHVLAFAMKLSDWAYDMKVLEQNLKERTDIIGVKLGHSRILTTREMVKSETDMLQHAVSERNKYPPLNAAFSDFNPILNPGQKKAVQHLLGSSDGVMLITGDAGVGKTTLLLDVKRGIEQAGSKLFAFAPSADASRGVMIEKGFEGATTIEALLQSKKLQGSVKNQVILIDEAGMVGSKTMNGLFKIAREQQARVILAGDVKQNHSVEAGDSYRALQHKVKLPVVRVNEIVRQNPAPKLKSAIKALAKGDQEQAFKILQKNGHIHEIQDQALRDKRIAKDYLKTLQAGQSVMLVSPTHAEGKRVSSLIRQELKNAKLIEQQDKDFPTQKSMSWTGTEKQDSTLYETGQIVTFHKRTPGFRHGTRYEVSGKNENGQILIKSDKGLPTPLPVQHFKNYEVYQKTTTQIASGDLIRITSNGKCVNGLSLHNGEVYKAKGFDKNGNILTQTGKTIPRDYGHFDQGYYRTSHAAQGKDADVLLLSQSSASFTASNQKQFYVSVSRGAKEARIYTDNIQELKNAIQKPADRMDALDLQKLEYEGYLKQRAYEEVHGKIHQNHHDKNQKQYGNTTGIKDRPTPPEMEREFSKF